MDGLSPQTGINGMSTSSLISPTATFSVRSRNPRAVVHENDPPSATNTFGARGHQMASFSGKRSFFASGHGSGRFGAHVQVTSTQPPPGSNQRALLSLLNDYHAQLPSEPLRRSIQYAITMMLMDQNIVSSLDLPSINVEGSTSSIANLITSPRNASLQRQQRAAELQCRADLAQLDQEQLLSCAAKAHSYIVVLADLFAGSMSGTTPAGGAPNHSHEITIDSMRSLGVPSFAYPPSRTESRSNTFLHESTTSSEASSAKRPSEASRAHAFHLENAAFTMSVLPPLNHLDSMHILNSVASQQLEPVHETNVATKTTDDLGVKMLNNYIVMETLGQGACGKVKLGYNVDKAQSVAIKIVRRSQTKRFGASTTKMDALMREIAVMKKLRHKGLVSLYEVIDDPEAEKLYLVMQYVDDGPIAKMNANHTCSTRPQAEVAMYARQVCAGLEYLHTHDIVHRDIKPENILVSSNKQAFLADFGVSEMFSKGDEARTVRGHKGTPMFMAPEVWQQSRSRRSDDEDEEEDELMEGFALDVWALGVTFYMLLMGRPPYPNVEEVMLQNNIPPPSFDDAPQEISLEWMALIRRMLEPKPYKRPQISVVRVTIKKIEKLCATQSPTPGGQSLTGPRALHQRRGVLLDVSEVACAFTPKVSRSLTPGVQGSGRRWVTEHPMPRKISGDHSDASKPLTPCVPAINLPYKRIDINDAPNPMAETLRSPSEKLETPLSTETCSTCAVSDVTTTSVPTDLIPTPPTRQKEQEPSPKVVRSITLDSPDDESNSSNRSNRLSSIATAQEKSAASSTSSSRPATVPVLNSRGEIRPVIVVEDSDLFE